MELTPLWVEIFTPAVPEACIQRGTYFHMVAAVAVFRVPGQYLDCGHQDVCQEGRPKTDFVGKIFDVESGTLENRQGMLRGLMKLWFLLVLGSLNLTSI